MVSVWGHALVGAMRASGSWFGGGTPDAEDESSEGWFGNASDDDDSSSTWFGNASGDSDTSDSWFDTDFGDADDDDGGWGDWGGDD